MTDFEGSPEELTFYKAGEPIMISLNELRSLSPAELEGLEAQDVETSVKKFDAWLYATGQRETD